MVWTLYALVFGLLAGGVVGYFIGRSQAPYVEEGRATKRANLNKIMNFVVDKDKFTNDDIRAELSVSNTTTSRYLEELERAGKIVQVGDTGSSVFYKKK